MSDRSKKIFLAISIILPFLLYCVYYYSIMVKNAPYRFSDFESITMNFGLGENHENRYNSLTGDYQYINSRDSLVKTRVKLNKDDLLYLHRKAAELGFWNFPAEFDTAGYENPVANPPSYYIEFKYKGKTKAVKYYTQNTEDPKLDAAAKSLITEISGRIEDASERK